MTFPNDPRHRSPMGDHNRRLTLGITAERFAEAAGITPDELGEYELTPTDGKFDIAVAQRIGEALERLESALPGRVDNGPKPEDDGPPGPTEGTARHTA
jgi:hypothetical protein